MIFVKRQNYFQTAQTEEVVSSVEVFNHKTGQQCFRNDLPFTLAAMVRALFYKHLHLHNIFCCYLYSSGANLRPILNFAPRG
jgi:hypothetical protein